MSGIPPPPPQSKPKRSSTFDYNTPLKSATFDSDGTSLGSAIEVRPMSTSDYRRFEPIARAYNLPVPDRRLNVISAKKRKPRSASNQRQSDSSDIEKGNGNANDDASLIVKVPNTIQEQEQNDVVLVEPITKENSITDIFADMIRPQKTALELQLEREISERILLSSKTQVKIENEKSSETSNAKNEKKKSYRQRKQELMNLTNKPDEIKVESNSNNDNENNSEKPPIEKKEIKRKRSKSKSTSRLSKSEIAQDDSFALPPPASNTTAVTTPKTIVEVNDNSMLFDETSFTKPRPTVSSLSFNSKSNVRYSFEANESTIKQMQQQNAEDSLFTTQKENSSLLSFRSDNDKEINNQIQQQQKQQEKEPEQIIVNQVQESIQQEEVTDEIKKSKKTKKKKAKETQQQEDSNQVKESIADPEPDDNRKETDETQLIKKEKKKKSKRVTPRSESINSRNYVSENKKSIKKKSKQNKQKKLQNLSTSMDNTEEKSLSASVKKSTANNKPLTSSFDMRNENIISSELNAEETGTVIEDDNERLIDLFETKSITDYNPSPPPPSTTNILMEEEQELPNDTSFASKDNEKIVKVADENKTKKPWKLTKNEWCMIITGSVLFFLIILLIIILALTLGTQRIAQSAFFINQNITNTTNATTTSTTTTSTTSTSTTSTSTTSTTTSQWCQYTTTPAQSQIISQSYSCPYNTPYVPQFLSLTNWYSYGYLINQQIVCSGSLLNIVCPTNQYIHIYAAYFGIQANTLTSCTPSSSISLTNCFNKNVFSTINSTCEYKNTCAINAMVSQLGDPCFGSSKQLMIQYQCIDNNNTIQILNQCPMNKNTSSACTASSNDPSVQILQLCEPNILNIQCTSLNLIQIVCAYYGIDSSYQCPGSNYAGAPTSCYSDSAKQLIISKCNGKTSCTILGNPNFQASNFTDPCYGFSKLMYVQYKCVSPSALTTTTTSTRQSTTTTLPYCPNYVTPTGTCSSVSNSPYIPEYLTANQTSFNFPIMQQIVCSGSTINLICPTNTVIHIYSAYFGIQSGTSLAKCFLMSGEKPALCYYQSSFNYINSTCEYQQTCSIVASTSALGDACANYIEKQLFIQYQCVDTYALNSTINQCNTVNTTKATVPAICPATVSNATNQTWCQGSTMNIVCSNPIQKITILCAFYGLHPSLSSSSCGISNLAPNIPVCYLQSSFTYVQSTCDNLNSCTINNFSNVFTDPCNGQTSEALYVQWKCS